MRWLFGCESQRTKGYQVGYQVGPSLSGQSKTLTGTCHEESMTHCVGNERFCPFLIIVDGYKLCTTVAFFENGNWFQRAAKKLQWSSPLHVVTWFWLASLHCCSYGNRVLPEFRWSTSQEHQLICGFSQVAYLSQTQLKTPKPGLLCRIQHRQHRFIIKCLGKSGNLGDTPCSDIRKRSY